MNDARVPIDQAVIFPSPILTHSTKTPFPLGDTAPPGTHFTLDLSSPQGNKIGGELCLNEAFLGHLSLQGFRKTEEVSEVEGTETGPTKLQELPFRQMGLRNAVNLHAAFHVEKEGMISEGFTHVMFN